MSEPILSVAIIIGDNYCAGLSTLCSLINQSRKPDQIVILENPLRGVRLSALFDQLTSLMGGAENLGIETTLVSTQGLSLVDARIRCERLLFGDLLMISDGDHFYPVDYLERAVEAFADGRRGFFGGAVESPSSLSGLDKGQSIELVKSANDYVAGGSFVYSECYRGVWSLVKTYTEGYGDDRAWRALCTSRGGERISYYEGIIVHLSLHERAKYPDLMSAPLIELCEQHLGAVTRVEF